MGRLKDLTLRCECCGQMGRDPDLFGECNCGANTWEETRPPPAPPPPPAAPRLHLVPPLSPPAPTTTERQPRPSSASQGFVDGTRVSRITVDDIEGARINELLGGIKRGCLLLIVGAAGAGKSTAIADLAVRAAHHWERPEAGPLRVPGCPIHWLDADQGDPALILQCFVQAGFADVFAEPGRVQRLADRLPFEEALARVPPAARVVVFDSLETWGGSNNHRQLEVLVALRAHPAWLKVMIGGTNARGVVSGIGALERADDVTVYAERTPEGRHELRYTKRRWQPCETARARGAGMPTPPPAPEPPVPAAPSSTPAPPAPPAPDFSEAFIAEAAGWTGPSGTRLLQAYMAQLRAQGVPRDSVDGWLEAVRQAREALEDGDQAEPGPRILH